MLDTIAGFADVIRSSLSPDRITATLTRCVAKPSERVTSNASLPTTGVRGRAFPSL